MFRKLACALIVTCNVVCSTRINARFVTPDDQWIRALRDNKSEQRQSAAKHLAEDSDQASLPHLVRALTDENVGVRLWAAFAVWKIGGRSDLAIPVFSEVLDGPYEFSCKLEAAELACKSQAKELVPQIVQLMRDSLSNDTQQLANSLVKVGKYAVPFLTPLLSDQEEPYLRNRVAGIIGELGPEAADASAALAEAIGKENDLVYQVKLAEAHWKVTKRPDLVMPVIVRILKEQPTVPTASNWLRISSKSERRVGKIRDRVSARNEALRIITELGPSAYEVIPQLIEALVDDYSLLDGPKRTPGPVASALISMGEVSVLALKSALTNTSDSMRRIYVLEVLSQLSAVARPSLPEIREALQDPSVQVRIGAAAALWNIEKDREAISVLIDVLSHGHGRFPTIAARQLGNIGSDAKSAVHELLEILGNPGVYCNGMVKKLESELRGIDNRLHRARASMAAIKNFPFQFRKSDLDDLPGEINLLEEQKVRLVLAIQDLKQVESLGKIDFANDETFPLVAPEFAFFRLICIETLGKIGPDAKEAIPLLAELMNGRVEERSIVAEAIWRIDPDALRAVSSQLLDILTLADMPESGLPPEILVGLDHHDDVKKVLRKMAVQLIPQLVLELNGSDSAKRRRSMDAVVVLAEEKGLESTVPALETVLRGDTDSSHRIMAAKCISRIGPRAATAINGLFEALKDIDPNVRQCASVALGRVGPGDIDAIEARLAYQDAIFRAGAAQAAGSMGELSKPLVPILLKLIKDDDVRVRQAAVDSLKQIEPAILMTETESAK